MDTTIDFGVNDNPQSGTKKQKCYLDIVLSKGSVGPFQSKESKSSRLTQAITAIKVNNDLSVRIGDSPTDVPKNKQKDEVIELRSSEGEPSDTLLKEVVAYFKAFDVATNGAIGTERYVAKQSSFETARRNILSEMGLNPDTDRIEFTEAQRTIYNKQMKGYSFTYYRIQLTWKQPGKKKVRTKSYSTLSPIDKAKWMDILQKNVDNIVGKVKVTRKQ